MMADYGISDATCDDLLRGVIVGSVGNSDSTATTPDGNPYRKKTPVFTTKTLPGGMKSVAMTGVAVDQSAFRKEYDPGNPAADSDGFVKMPNVDVPEEMVDMLGAARAYQANLTAIGLIRDTIHRALELGK